MQVSKGTNSPDFCVFQFVNVIYDMFNKFQVHTVIDCNSFTIHFLSSTHTALSLPLL